MATSMDTHPCTWRAAPTHGQHQWQSGMPLPEVQSDRWGLLAAFVDFGGAIQGECAAIQTSACRLFVLYCALPCVGVLVPSICLYCTLLLLGARNLLCLYSLFKCSYPPLFGTVPSFVFYSYPPFISNSYPTTMSCHPGGLVRVGPPN